MGLVLPGDANSRPAPLGQVYRPRGENARLPSHLRPRQEQVGRESERHQPASRRQMKKLSALTSATLLLLSFGPLAHAAGPAKGHPSRTSFATTSHTTYRP